MSEIITQPLGVIATNSSNFIRPIVADMTTYMSGFTVAATTFILGGIFLLLVIAYVIFKLYGQPMSVAAKGSSIIQHFDTPKSAVIKDAIISGGACRYKNLRDGTLAVTTNSIVSMGGKNAILTFSGLGISIPVPQLAAMTLLANNGICIEQKINEKTNLYEYVLNCNMDENTIVLQGYSFPDFRETLKQTKYKRYIPLTIESVTNFERKNISADYTETKIKYASMLKDDIHTKTNDFELLLYGLFAAGLPLIAYMLLYK